MTLKYSVIASGTIIHRNSVATAGAIKARGRNLFIGGVVVWVLVQAEAAVACRGCRATGSVHVPRQRPLAAASSFTSLRRSPGTRRRQRGVTCVDGRRRCRIRALGCSVQ